MAKGKWREMVDEIISESGSADVFNHDPDRHQSILRKELLRSLFNATLQPMALAAQNHEKVSDAIEGVVDAIIENAKRDGLDLDGELIDHLTDISAKLYAVEESWESIHKLLNAK